MVEGLRLGAHHAGGRAPLLALAAHLVPPADHTCLLSGRMVEWLRLGAHHARRRAPRLARAARPSPCARLTACQQLHTLQPSPHAGGAHQRP